MSESEFELDAWVTWIKAADSEAERDRRTTEAVLAVLSPETRVRLARVSVAALLERQGGELR